MPHHRDPTASLALSALLAVLNLPACLAESDPPVELEGEARSQAAPPGPRDRTCGDYLDAPENETFHRLDEVNRQLLDELGDCLRETCFQQCATSYASCWQCGELSCPEQMAACQDGVLLEEGEDAG